MYVDLGAEQLVAVERDGLKIAVEIKSFVGPSEIEDLKNALGQYVLCDTRNRTRPRVVSCHTTSHVCRAVRGTAWSSIECQ